MARKKAWKWTPARRAAFNKMRAASKRGRRGRRGRKNPPIGRAAVPVHHYERTSGGVTAYSRRQPTGVAKAEVRARRAAYAHAASSFRWAAPKSAKKSRKARKGRPRRKNPEVLLVNPSPMFGGRSMSKKRRSSKRRRGHGHRRSFRNPGIKGVVQSLTKAAVPALAGGVALGFINEKVKVTGIAKIGLQLALAVAPTFIKPLGKMLGPNGPAIWMGAVLGSVGSRIGSNLAAGRGLLSEEPLHALADYSDDGVSALLEDAPATLSVLAAEEEVNALLEDEEGN